MHEADSSGEPGATIAVAVCSSTDPVVVGADALRAALAGAPNARWVAVVAPGPHAPDGDTAHATQYAAAFDTFLDEAIAAVARGAGGAVATMPVTDALKSVITSADGRVLVQATVDRSTFRRLVAPVFAPRWAVEALLRTAVEAGEHDLRPVRDLAALALQFDALVPPAG